METDYHDHDDRYPREQDHRNLYHRVVDLEKQMSRLQEQLDEVRVVNQNVSKRLHAAEVRGSRLSEMQDQTMKSLLRLGEQVGKIAAWSEEQQTWSKATDKNYDLSRQVVLDIGKLLREHIENQVKALAGIDARVVLLENGIAVDGIEDEPTIDQDA